MKVGRRCPTAGTKEGALRFLSRCDMRASLVTPARIAWVLAALVAFISQSIVLQTHLHLPLISSAQPGASAVIGLSAPEPDDDRAVCPICQDAAQSGHYLSPVVFVVPIVAALVTVFGTASFLRWPLRHASPGWYGRGPPRRSAHH